MAEAIQLDVNFLKSIHGIMKLIQIILGFVACILVGFYCATDSQSEITITFCASVGTVYWIESFGGQGFVLAVLSICIIVNILQYLLHLLSLNKHWTEVNWRLTEMIYAIVLFSLLIICFIMEIYYCIRFESTIGYLDGNKVYGRWLVGAIFILLLDVLFGAEAFLIRSGRIDY